MSIICLMCLRMFPQDNEMDLKRGNFAPNGVAAQYSVRRIETHTGIAVAHTIFNVRK